MSNSEAVRHALRYVFDPELGVNIVELGLVYDVTVTAQVAHVQMTLTTPGCPLHDTLVSTVDEVVRYMCDDIERVEVQIVWEPRWHPERMSPTARQQLGWEL